MWTVRDGMSECTGQGSVCHGLHRSWECCGCRSGRRSGRREARSDSASFHCQWDDEGNAILRNLVRQLHLVVGCSGRRRLQERPNGYGFDARAERLQPNELGSHHCASGRLRVARVRRRAQRGALLSDGRDDYERYDDHQKRGRVRGNARHAREDGKDGADASGRASVCPLWAAAVDRLRTRRADYRRRRNRDGIRFEAVPAEPELQPRQPALQELRRRKRRVPDAPSAADRRRQRAVSVRALSFVLWLLFSYCCCSHFQSAMAFASSAWM